jgi:hypothetical protein
MTLMGGLSIVTRQYAGDRRVRRICDGFVGAFICAGFADAAIAAMGSSSVFVCIGKQLVETGNDIDEALGHGFFPLAIRSILVDINYSLRERLGGFLR